MRFIQINFVLDLSKDAHSTMSTPPDLDDLDACLAWSRADLDAYALLRLTPTTCTDDAVEENRLLLSVYFNPRPDDSPANADARAEILAKVLAACRSIATAAARQDYNVAIGLDHNSIGDRRDGLLGGISARLLGGAYGRIVRAVARVSTSGLSLPTIVVVGN